MTIHDDLTAHTIYHDNPSQHAPTSSFCSPTTPPSHKYGGALFRPSDQPNRLCLFLLLDERGQRREPPWPPNREVQAHDTHRTAPEPPPRIQQSALDRQTRPETQSGRSMERAKKITYEHSKVPHTYIPTPAPASLIRAGTVTPLLVAHGSHN
jgi:hypothetical protein